MLNKMRCRICSKLKICGLLMLVGMFHVIYQQYDIHTSKISYDEGQIPDSNVKYVVTNLPTSLPVPVEIDYGQPQWINKNYSLILFTTFNLFNVNLYHLYAHNIVIKNWAQFLPDVQPVLFADTYTHPLVKHAERNKWIVFATPSVNEYGTPHLKPMYECVFRNFNSTFYAFANGDNLFDNTFLQTLHAVKLKLPAYDNNVMMIGRRYNIDADLNTSASNYITENLKPIIVALNITQQPVYAEDYFVFTRDGSSMNWTGLADVVIGRRGYDNYLVAKARENMVNVIDASKTIIDIHLTQPNMAFGSQNRADHCYNLQLIGKFDFKAGRTHRVKFYTDYAKSTEEIDIMTRNSKLNITNSSSAIIIPCK